MLFGYGETAAALKMCFPAQSNSVLFSRLERSTDEKKAAPEGAALKERTEIRSERGRQARWLGASTGSCTGLPGCRRRLGYTSPC